MAISNKKLFEKITFKKGDAILFALSMLSLGLAILGIDIYRLTIIDVKYIIASITAGVVLSLTVRASVLKTNYSPFWIFFIKAMIGAGFFLLSVTLLQSAICRQRNINGRF